MSEKHSNNSYFKILSMGLNKTGQYLGPLQKKHRADH